jgi:hypothetical protein
LPFFFGDSQNAPHRIHKPPADMYVCTRCLLVKKTPFTSRKIRPKNVGFKKLGLLQNDSSFYKMAEAKKSLRYEEENLDGLSLYGGQVLLIN